MGEEVVLEEGCFSFSFFVASNALTGVFCVGTFWVPIFSCFVHVFSKRGIRVGDRIRRSSGVFSFLLLGDI